MNYSVSYIIFPSYAVAWWYSSCNNDVDGVDQARQVAQEGQDHVDPKIRAATWLEEHADGLKYTVLYSYHEIYNIIQVKN